MQIQSFSTLGRVRIRNTYLPLLTRLSLAGRLLPKSDSAVRSVQLSWVSHPLLPPTTSSRGRLSLFPASEATKLTRWRLQEVYLDDALEQRLHLHLTTTTTIDISAPTEGPATTAEVILHWALNTQALRLKEGVGLHSILEMSCRAPMRRQGLVERCQS